MGFSLGNMAAAMPAAFEGSTQVQEQPLKLASMQADVQGKQLNNVEKQMQIKQMQLQQAMQQQESDILKEQAGEEEITPTDASLSQDGSVVSPLLDSLKKTAYAQAKAGDVTGHRQTLKDIVDLQNKNSEIIQRNLGVIKDKEEHLARSAQYALDNKDIEGGLSILSQVDPAEAMKLYRQFPKGQDGKILWSPQVEASLKQEVAKNTSIKDRVAIEEKRIADARRLDEDKQRALDKQTQFSIQRTGQAIQREIAMMAHEDRLDSLQVKKDKASADAVKSAAKERRIGKLSDPKEVERTSSELKLEMPDMPRATLDRMAEDIRTKQRQMLKEDASISVQDAYDQAYDEVKSNVSTTGQHEVPFVGGVLGIPKTVGGKKTYDNTPKGKGGFSAEESKVLSKYGL